MTKALQPYAGLIDLLLVAVIVCDVSCNLIKINYTRLYYITDQ